MTGQPPRTQPPLVVTVDTAAVERAVARAPRVAYFWLRSYLGRVFGRHRKHWLRKKQVRFTRGGTSGRGIVVKGVNEGNVPPLDNEVSYVVEPRAERLGGVAVARAAIGKLRGEAITGNKILVVHEFGGDIRSRGWMAVPYKTRPHNIGRWRERNADKQLLTLPSKRGRDKLLVYEVQKKRARGRTRKGEAPKTRDKLRLRFVLTRLVRMKPKLGYYDAWDTLVQERDQLWAETATNLEKDLARGVDS